MKYDFSSKRLAIWCESIEEQKKVLEIIEREHPNLRWRGDDKPTEFYKDLECVELGFAYGLNQFGFACESGWHENAEDSEAEQTINAKDYIDSFEDERDDCCVPAFVMSALKNEDMAVFKKSVGVLENLVETLDSLKHFAYNLRKEKDVLKLIEDIKKLKGKK